VLARADEQVKSSQDSDKMIIAVAVSEIIVKSPPH
jgi:hypothetical protein